MISNRSEKKVADFDSFAGALALASFTATHWVHRGIVSVIPGSGILGLLWHLLL